MFNFYNNNQYENHSNQPSTIQANTMDNFNTLQNARQDLIGEIEAVIQYDNHIHTSTDRMATETWENIKHEELTHVGELLGLINYLSPTDRQFVQSGLNEFTERMNGRQS